MRSYTENKQFNEAEEVYNYLKNKTIYNNYQIDFYKYSVYLFKQLKKNSELLINLKKIENLTKDRTLENKVYFLIGQIHLNNWCLPVTIGLGKCIIADKTISINIKESMI